MRIMVHPLPEGGPPRVSMGLSVDLPAHAEAGGAGDVVLRSERVGEPVSAALPFRVLLAADLCPPAPGADEPPRLARVDASSFADLMRAWAPRLALDVPDRVGGAPERLVTLDLAFDDLKAFRPDEVAARVPALASLLGLREHTAAVLDGQSAADGLARHADTSEAPAAWIARARAALAAPSTPAPSPFRPPVSAPGASRLDRLFDLVEVGAAEPAPTPDALAVPATLANALVGAAGGRAGYDRGALLALRTDLDRALSAAVRDVVTAPRFQALEAAWRGLKLLVDRLPFRDGVRLDVLAVAKAGVADALTTHVLEADADGAPPVSLVVLDFAFDRTLPDLERLADLAAVGAALPAPVVGAASPALLGAGDARELAGLPPLNQHLTRPEFVHWNALRADGAARTITLALPDFLLRARHGDDAPVKRFAYTAPPADDATGYLWGHASLAVGLAVAAAFGRTGVPARFARPDPAARVGELPVWPSNGFHTPLRVTLDQARLADLAEAGFAVLGARARTDAVVLEAAPSIVRPPAYDDAEATAEARLHATLACTLLTSRAAHFLLTLPQPDDRTAPALEAAARAWLGGWLGAAHTAADAVTAEVVDGAEGSGPVMALRLRAPADVLGVPLQFVLHAPLDGGVLRS